MDAAPSILTVVGSLQKAFQDLMTASYKAATPILIVNCKVMFDGLADGPMSVESLVSRIWLSYLTFLDSMKTSVREQIVSNVAVEDDVVITLSHCMSNNKIKHG